MKRFGANADLYLRQAVQEADQRQAAIEQQLLHTSKALPVATHLYAEVQIHLI
jgi:hypothetical protein